MRDQINDVWHKRAEKGVVVAQLNGSLVFWRNGRAIETDTEGQ